MAQQTSTLEAKLNDIFVKNAPELPGDFKKFLVKVAPAVSLVVGILTLLSAWSLWRWAHDADQLVRYSDRICTAYSDYSCGMHVSHLTVWVWLGVFFLLTEGLLYVFAYSGLKAHAKQGWDYLYYGALVNVVYAIITLFTAYDVVGHFIGALLASTIGFYLLFQIRDVYVGISHTGRHKPTKHSLPNRLKEPRK